MSEVGYMAHRQKMLHILALKQSFLSLVPTAYIGTVLISKSQKHLKITFLAVSPKQSRLSLSGITTTLQSKPYHFVFAFFNSIQPGGSVLLHSKPTTHFNLYLQFWCVVSRNGKAGDQWRIQGGQFGATSPPNFCSAPLNGAPLPQMRPFLVPMEVETDFKIL